MRSRTTTTCRTSSRTTRSQPRFRRSSTTRNSVPLRVLGIDPGLTRCGLGIVDVDSRRNATLVYVGVVRTPPDQALEQRLLTIHRAIADVIDEHGPQAVAL